MAKWKPSWELASIPDDKFMSEKQRRIAGAGWIKRRFLRSRPPAECYPAEPSLLEIHGPCQGKGVDVVIVDELAHPVGS